MEKREKKPIDIVMDTNVLISALLSRDGKCAKILEHVIDGCLINFISHDILSELSNVLKRPKFSKVLSQNDIKSYLKLISEISSMVVPHTKFHLCKDPDDDKFLEVAYDSCARIIITGDPDLLELRDKNSRETKLLSKTIKILKPAEFLELLRTKYTHN